MKNKTLVLTALMCLTAVLFITFFPLTAHGAASENIEDLEKLESMRNAQKTNADDGATYATIPHESTSENGTFVTVFTVCFMIVLVIAGAFVMFYKR